MPNKLSPSETTILVVDDNESVLHVVVSILKRAGFQVLSANNGPDAIKMAENMDTNVDLLLSDLDMPQISGPDLGEAMRKGRPDMRVMLMSCGHEGNLLVLNYGWAYIQKPFVPTKLVEMILSLLRSPDRSQSWRSRIRQP